MKTMIRIEKSNDFLIINNTGLRDRILSWKAKGILAYLLSLQDDWQIYVEELSNHSRDGIDSTLSAMLLNTKVLNTNINLEEETTQGVDVEQEIIKTYKIVYLVK